MPRRCVAAGCDTVSGMGYSLHSFPKDETTRRKWRSAVKRQRVNWDGPSSSSLLCSKHFMEDCFVTEGVRYRDALGVSSLTLFPRYLQGAPIIKMLVVALLSVAARYPKEESKDR